MKRRARPILNLLTMLSLLLCIAVLGLWVRGYWASDSIVYHRKDDSLFAVGNVKGKLLLLSMVRKEPTPKEWDGLQDPIGWRFKHDPPNDGSAWGFGSPEHHWRFAGLWYRRGKQLWFECRSLHVPYALLLLATALLPAHRAFWHHRSSPRWRQKHGLCPSCGYDLRETPDRCPECGDIPTRIADNEV